MRKSHAARASASDPSPVHRFSPRRYRLFALAIKLDFTANDDEVSGALFAVRLTQKCRLLTRKQAAALLARWEVKGRPEAVLLSRVAPEISISSGDFGRTTGEQRGCSGLPTCNCSMLVFARALLERGTHAAFRHHARRFP